MKAYYGEVWRTEPGLLWGVNERWVPAPQLTDKEIEEAHPWSIETVEIIDYVHTGYEVRAICKTEQNTLFDSPLGKLKILEE